MSDSPIRSMQNTIKFLAQKNNEMQELIEECFKDIFGDDYKSAVWRFYAEYESQDDCIGSLCCYKSNIELDKENTKKWQKQKEKLNEDN